MEKVLLTKESQSDVYERALSVLHEEGVLVYPNDTMYGLGCDPFSQKAMAGIVSIKGREKKKMPLLIAADIDMVARFAILSDQARALAEAFWPGPLSLCLPRRAGTLSDFYPHMDTIVFRVPDHEFSHALCEQFDSPLVSTSVNRSGKPASRSIEEAEAQFGADFDKVDLVIDRGPYEEATPSTIVKVETNGSLEILREGALTAELIQNQVK